VVRGRARRTCRSPVRPPPSVVPVSLCAGGPVVGGGHGLCASVHSDRAQRRQRGLAVCAPSRPASRCPRPRKQGAGEEARPVRLTPRAQPMCPCPSPVAASRSRTRNLRILDPAYEPLRYSGDESPIAIRPSMSVSPVALRPCLSPVSPLSLPVPVYSLSLSVPVCPMCSCPCRPSPSALVCRPSPSAPVLRVPCPRLHGGVLGLWRDGGGVERP
jgi:hypothetical protein